MKPRYILTGEVYEHSFDTNGLKHWVFLMGTFRRHVELIWVIGKKAYVLKRVHT